MLTPAGDEELLERQTALRAEARELLEDPTWTAVFADFDPPIVTGSYVSGLMSWREIDIMVLGGHDFTPYDVIQLLQRIVALPGVVGFDYHDERGSRSPTGETRDERYHTTITLERTSSRQERTWRIDLSIWLHDDHVNVTEWHEALRDSITTEQRLAVLRIKDVWHRLPTYPDEVGGLEIYTAVVDDCIRTPQQFSAWLVEHGLPN